MIQAVLSGKSLGYEYTEDILTSTVFGMLKYLPMNKVLIPFIESALLYGKNQTTLWEKLNAEGIELRCYKDVELIFWARNRNFGEPDLILIFSGHVHNKEDLLLVVEAKFKSKKSGTGEHDQLNRYFEAINKDINNFAETKVSGFIGRKGYIVYLTQFNAYDEIKESTELIKNKNGVTDEVLFHLRWHQLHKVLESVIGGCSCAEKMIAEDLINYLEKLGLREYSGITLPGEVLYEIVSNPYPVFYKQNNRLSDKTTYFDELPELIINDRDGYFFGGGVNG